MASPRFAMHVSCTNYNNLISKKSRQFLNEKSVIINLPKKSIYCLPDDFLNLNEFQNFFVKNEKKSINLT